MYLPGQAGYKDNVTSTGQGSGNVDKAKQMLTAAGYTGVGSALKTKSGDAVTLSCLYSAGNTVRQSECQIVQQTLRPARHQGRPQDVDRPARAVLG